MKKAKNLSLPASRKGKAAPEAEPALVVVNSKLELVQLLIPIALERVKEILQEEVTQLAGPLVD